MQHTLFERHFGNILRTSLGNLYAAQKERFFTEVTKNLARYRSENNFIGPSK